MIAATFVSFSARCFRFLSALVERGLERTLERALESVRERVKEG